MKSLRDFNLKDKKVLVRLDINSPLDPKTKKIVDTTRIEKSLPTLKQLLEGGAAMAIIAHQGDTLDYQNLYPLEEHAAILTGLLGKEVRYLEDVCGPTAIKAVKELKPGEIVLLGNLRYLTEEISTFETVVKLSAKEMTNTWLVRSLAPLFDLYVNDAFSAAHRNCPSMVAFQEVLPSAAGDLLFQEYSVLSKLVKEPEHPSIFVLGGAKISDAFGMMEQVLKNGTADKILTSGVTGQVFLLAAGHKLGEKTNKFLADRKLLDFIEPAKKYLKEFPDKILMPLDLAYEKDGKRAEIEVSDLPLEADFMDIGSKTIEKYKDIIDSAAGIFINGPAGVYEDEKFAEGTQQVWQAIADSSGYSVMGGGDSVSAARKFIDLEKINYICTAGGAMVRFMTGKTLPLIEAMAGNTMKEKE